LAGQTAGVESPERPPQRESDRGAGHPDDGDEALQALADIHLVRGLLDRAELVAVPTHQGTGGELVRDRGHAAHE